MIIASVDGDFTVKTYRRDKSGVRLEPANPDYPVIRLRAGQRFVFSPYVETKASPLYKTIDSLNARFGKGKVFSASEGIGERSWKMKRSKLSKRASTRWDELMVVK